MRNHQRLKQMLKGSGCKSWEPPTQGCMSPAERSGPATPGAGRASSLQVSQTGEGRESNSLPKTLESDRTDQSDDVQSDKVPQSVPESEAELKGAETSQAPVAKPRDGQSPI